MSWHLVDGVPLPDRVSGHPALDFCNTRAGWPSAEAGGPAKEYLTSPRVLTLWAMDAGLLPPSADATEGGSGAGTDDGGTGDAADEALVRALVLRTALYRCLLGRGSGDDWRLLSREATAARAAATLTPGSDGRAHWRPTDPPGGADGAAATAALHVVAAAAEDLVTSPLAGCVAACPGDGCGWLFADPRRRRRWCSMAVCGNRAKARRYAERSNAK